MKKKKTLLVDLDGVLNDYTGDYDENFIPPLKISAKNFLAFCAMHYSVKIFTSRPLPLVQKWVEDNSLTEFITGVTNIKEPSYLIIDDRCIRYAGDYDKTIMDLESFKPWYKNQIL